MSDGNKTQENQKAAKVRRKPERDSVLTPTFAVARRGTNGTLWDRNQQESGLLQRQCACGTHIIAGGMCDACRQKQDSSLLQRNATDTEPNAVLNNPDEIQTIPKAGFAQGFSQIPAYSKSSPSAIQTTLFPASSGNQDKQKSPKPSLPKDSEATEETMSDPTPIQHSAFSDPEIDQRQRAKAGTTIQRLVIQRVTDAQRYENTLTNAGTTRAAWDSGYSNATFLGVNIARGIHQELANRLTLAETYLRGQFPGRTDAQIATEIGLYSMSGRRAVRNAVGGSKLSFHSFGLAIDVNYRGNPFIGRSTEVAQIIDRIFQFMTGNAFNIRTRQRGTPEEIRSRLETVSDAFANYFRMRGDRDLIRAHLASRGQAQDAARIQQVFDQIEADATNQALLNDMEMTGAGPRPLTSGFIDLSEQLVEAFSNQAGLFWGAQYRTGKDIMHFDWRRGTIRDSHRE